MRITPTGEYYAALTAYLYRELRIRKKKPTVLEVVRQLNMENEAEERYSYTASVDIDLDVIMRCLRLYHTRQAEKARREAIFDIDSADVEATPREETD